jgi:F-type H+-transporting ATPase subunit gamma
METHKLNSFLDVQHSVVRHIEMIASDFLCFYPDTLNQSVTASVDAYLPTVTERDFCGDFNHALLRHFESMAKANDADKLPIIIVGHK